MWKLGFGLTGLAFTCIAGPAYAQEPADRPRFEIGAQVTSPNLKEFSFLARRSEIGVGGRFTVNLGDLLATEAEPEADD